MNNRFSFSFLLAALIIIAHFTLAMLAPDFVSVSLPHLLVIYGILASLTLLHLLGSYFVKNHFPEQAGLIVIAMNMLKMLLAMILLFVVVIPLTGKGVAVAVNFMVAYFFFIFIDSILSIILLTHK